MKLTTSKLIRTAGLSAMAAGILFIIIQMIHPIDVLASVTTARWATVHYLSIAMDLLSLLGLTGLYARQVEKSGWLGLAGYLLFSLFWASSLAFHFIEAFISPAVANVAPKVVEGLLGLVTGHASEINLGALPTVYAVTGALYMLGSLSFGIATFRARLLPRWAAILLAASGPLAALMTSLLKHPLDRLAAVPMGLALAWLGYALLSERRAPVAEPIRSLGQAQFSLTGAD
jgi:hypothetical protein